MFKLHGFVCVVEQGNGMIDIHCHDSWSTIVMMIVLFYYHGSSTRYGTEYMYFCDLQSTLHANVVANCLVFENILTLMLLEI